MSETQVIEKSKIVPNTFQTPNVLTDEYMRFLTGDETKCYLAITRKTLGWLKRSDRIATSIIADMTGLADATITDCMKSLTAFGLIVRVSENDPRHNYGIEWALEMDSNKINLIAMQERTGKKELKGKVWGEKMKIKKAIKAGTYQIPTYLTKDGGGDLSNASQKPLSKATKDLIYICPIAAKISELKFPFNPNSGTIIQIWKDDFPDDVIIRALEMSKGKSINYADKILIGWKANGIPPTREEQIKQAKGNQRNDRTQPAANTGNSLEITPELEALGRRIVAKQRAAANQGV